MGSLSGIARKGTVASLILSFLWFDISHQLSDLPWLHRFMVTGFIATMKVLTSDLTSIATHPLALWEGLVLLHNMVPAPDRFSLLIPF